jgi:penicillin-binding protein 1A
MCFSAGIAVDPAPSYALFHLFAMIRPFPKPRLFVPSMKLLQYLSRHFVVALMSLMASAVILVGCIYFYMLFQLPDVNALKDYKLQIPLRIFTHDGQLIAEYGAMRRDPVTLDQVPKPLLNAIIATEDQRFFENSGVDFIGILRAGKELLLTGQKNQGASTISMQVARNFFLTPEKTFSRKINEILLALKINNTFSKEKILELYLNKIYLGQHAYGVSSAAAIYYGKSLQDLTLAEMATIAGLPQAPSRENPITNPAAAKIRRDHVLQRMLELKHINQKEYEEATRAPIATYYHGPKITVSAPHIGEMVRNVVYQQFGEEAYTTGLNVYTTLSAQLQQTASSALSDGLIAYERRHRGYRGPEKNLGALPVDLAPWQKALGDAPQNDGFIPAAIIRVEKNGNANAVLASGEKITILASGFSWARQSKNTAIKVGDVIRVLEKSGKWQLTQIPRVQGALVSLNPGDGAVLALNGGFNDSDNGFNRAIQAYRQPGSNFKPFIYAAALSKGYTLATIVSNAPIEINDTGDSNNLWRPQNSDNTFGGPTRLHIGLVRSLNLVSIRVLQMIGIPDAIEYVTKFGFERSKLPSSLSLALGTASVTPIQIAAGYSVFANGGYRVTPYFIDRIQSADGKVLYQANSPTAPGYTKLGDATTTMPLPPKAIEPDIAYLMTNVLQDVIKSGTGYGAQALKRNDIAGKTGTTNRQVDAWFSGFNRRIETTVWVGYDQPKPLNEYGGQAALPIWVDFMKVALANAPEETLAPPENIVSARIDPDDGLLAQPDQENAIFEVFRADTVPTETSNGENNPNADQYGNSEEVQLF